MKRGCLDGIQYFYSRVKLDGREQILRKIWWGFVRWADEIDFPYEGVAPYQSKGRASELWQWRWDPGRGRSFVWCKIRGHTRVEEEAKRQKKKKVAPKTDKKRTHNYLNLAPKTFTVSAPPQFQLLKFDPLEHLNWKFLHHRLWWLKEKHSTLEQSIVSQHSGYIIIV